jgi:hypothetical protein
MQYAFMRFPPLIGPLRKALREGTEDVANTDVESMLQFFAVQFGLDVYSQQVCPTSLRPMSPSIMADKILSELVCDG